jgi:putative aldouronate transport system substrate-binding protein
MKKILALMLAMALVLSMMVACGNETSSSETTEATNASESVSAEDETIQEESTASVDETSDVAAETSAAELDDQTVEEEDPWGGLVLPLTDDSVTLTMLKDWSANLQLVQPDPEQTSFYQEMEKRTGIHIEITATQDYNTDFSLMVAAGSYYDLLSSFSRAYSGGVEVALQDDVLVDFVPYIESGVMPNFAAFLEEYPIVTTVCYTSGGQIGELVGLSSDMLNGSTRDDTIKGMYTRQDWLDELGIDAPVTYDDYYNMLSLFKTELNVDYPFYLESGGIPQLDKMISGYGTLGYFTGRGSPFFVDDGTVCFGPTDSGYKSYLDMMAQWYAEGLINQDFYTVQKTDAENDFLSGRYGTYMDNDNSMHIYEESATEEGFTLVAIADGTPDDTYTDYVERVADLTWNSGWSITTSCENIELACQWFDYLYSPEGTILMNYGVEGEGFNYVDGEPVLSDLVLANPDGLVTNNALSIYAGYMMPGITDSAKLLASYTEAEKAAADIWYPVVNSTKSTLPDAVSMNDAESDAYSQVISDIQTVVNEYTIKVITGADTTDNFDDFVAQIESLNIATAIEAKQSAYDRYLESKE